MKVTLVTPRILENPTEKLEEIIIDKEKTSQTQENITDNKLTNDKNVKTEKGSLVNVDKFFIKIKYSLLPLETVVILFFAYLVINPEVIPKLQKYNNQIESKLLRVFQLLLNLNCFYNILQSSYQKFKLRWRHFTCAYLIVANTGLVYQNPLNVRLGLNLALCAYAIFQLLFCVFIGEIKLIKSTIASYIPRICFILFLIFSEDENNKLLFPAIVTSFISFNRLNNHITHIRTHGKERKTDFLSYFLLYTNIIDLFITMHLGMRVYNLYGFKLNFFVTEY